MSDRENTDKVRISQVLAGTLAAVTAALIGSTMGVAGTVVGAGLASAVSTVGGALYLRSIERTRASVRTVRAKVVGKSGDTTVLVADEDPVEGDEVEASTAEEPDDRPPEEARWPRWPMLVVGSLAVFALGMLAVTGVEWVRGESLSGGAGTTFGSIVQEHRGGGTQQPEQPADPTSTTTPTAPATDSAPPTSTTTGPTSTTTRSPSSSPTTTTPPATTSTEVAPPGGSVIPTN
ncbi:MAG: hypothetical protein WBA97_04495 [Actinophytocola sp.]|uniref:hypothetical protein n=1 Tax=Actinophytocola sp. TaxID=1872138 RepID=UPI003C70CA4A